jgi:17beta-estradiol 17-dehydrogenase / very-long-chain 3-oxoacyl-CoA reductase
LLVNNVGTSDINIFEKMNQSFIVDIININCIGMAALTSYVLKNMEKRKQKSAIINLSSFMGDMAYPFITLYAATKAFNK